MKKPFILAFSLCITLLAIAQNEQPHPKSFYYKFAPAGLYTGKLTLGVEYNIKAKKSVEILIGFPKTAKRSFEYDGSSSDIESKAFSILVGYRYYLGRDKMVSGLYFQPYFKYLQHDATGLLKGSLESQYANFDTDSKYTGYGIGAQFGIQALIAKRLTLDFFLIGPEANMVKYSALLTDVASTIPWTHVQAQEAERDIREALNNIPFLNEQMEIEVSQSDKTVSMRYNGFLPGFRVGASIGFRLGK